MTMISGLDHIQLAIPPGGEERAREFYGRTLGLVEVAKPEPLAGRGGCWFAGPGVQLHLGVETPFAPAQKAHPAFLVRDLAACERALRAAGAAITPDATLPHVRRFYATDPFGNRVEFIQQGDGFSQSEQRPAHRGG
jgi:catechol 2,3-dioxygenase-like lactoylglutathione lyase family enzyme